MNKNLILLFGVFLLCGCHVTESGNEWIFRRFGINFPFMVDSTNIIKEDRNWFIAIRLSEAQVRQIRNNDFRINGFLGWRENDRNITFGVKEVYQIQTKDHWLVNYKMGGTSSNYIAIYLDSSNRILVFFWGITYGC